MIALKTYLVGFSVKFYIQITLSEIVKEKDFLQQLWAVAVYTGRESKMALNMKITKNKFSSLEASLNKVLVIQNWC
jgi:hypothetical protein